MWGLAILFPSNIFTAPRDRSLSCKHPKLFSRNNRSYSTTCNHYVLQVCVREKKTEKESRCKDEMKKQCCRWVMLCMRVCVAQWSGDLYQQQVCIAVTSDKWTEKWISYFLDKQMLYNKSYSASLKNSWVEMATRASCEPQSFTNMP